MVPPCACSLFHNFDNQPIVTSLNKRDLNCPSIILQRTYWTAVLPLTSLDSNKFWNFRSSIWTFILLVQHIIYHILKSTDCDDGYALLAFPKSPKISCNLVYLETMFVCFPTTSISSISHVKSQQLISISPKCFNPWVIKKKKDVMVHTQKSQSQNESIFLLTFLDFPKGFISCTLHSIYPSWI